MHAAIRNCYVISTNLDRALLGYFRRDHLMYILSVRYIALPAGA